MLRLCLRIRSLDFRPLFRHLSHWQYRLNGLPPPPSTFILRCLPHFGWADIAVVVMLLCFISIYISHASRSAWWPDACLVCAINVFHWFVISVAFNSITNAHCEVFVAKLQYIDSEKIGIKRHVYRINTFPNVSFRCKGWFGWWAPQKDVSVVVVVVSSLYTVSIKHLITIL